jgi:hypothetical protein
MRFIAVAMRFIAMCLVVGCLLIPSRALAQDAEALRRELEQIKQQFEGAKQEYERAIKSLSERLQRVESRPQVAATPPAVVQAPPAPPPPAPPTLMEVVRPRPPFSLTARRGPGQFVFDIGVAGDFVGNITQDNVDKANAGTFEGRENRFFPREIELNLFGQIDPYAYGEVRLEAAEEFEDGERKLEVTLAEAHLTLLALPFGTQAKLGRMRNRFGLLNQLHFHDLPQIDRPNVLVRFFGEEQLRENGGEVTWVPPLPFYLEVLAGVFDGDNDVAFGRGSVKYPLVTGRLRTFFELGEAAQFGAIQVGVSGARGTDEDRLRNTVLGFDAKYKLIPEGWRHPLFTVAGEALFGNRRVNVEVDADDDGVVDFTEKRRRERFGWYTYAEVQPWRRWAFGARYDNTQFPINPGREWAIEPYVAFWPSEFLRFRLAYKHTERSNREGFSANDATARIADEVLFQGTFFLGAHPAHLF